MTELIWIYCGLRNLFFMVFVSKRDLNDIQLIFFTLELISNPTFIETYVNIRSMQILALQILTIAWTQD